MKDYIQSRPRPTLTSRNMSKVPNHQRTIIRVFTLQTNTVSADAAGVEDAAGVDAHVDLVVLVADEALLLGLLLVDVVYVAV